MTIEPTDFGPSFGQWVRRRRQALDLTQAQLAARTACSVALIRKVEADERRPSRTIAELLAEALAIAPAARPAFLHAARRVPGALNLTAAPEIDPSPVVSLPPAPARPLVTPWPELTTSLIGREGEVAALVSLIQRPACRLVTVVGVGGMGKTRLALAMVAAVQSLFPDGVYVVPLAPLRDGQLLIPAIADAVGIVLPSTGDLQVHLQQQLQERNLLLLLDNAEHLLDEVVPVVTALLRTNAVRIVLTSRERLNLQREWIFDLQGLAVPPANWAALPEPPTLTDYSAVQFFIDCAQRVTFDFAWQPHAAAIVRICRLVEGLPLGIELAAAWVHVLSCEEIAEEIAQTIDFLTINQRDVPLRHRSIRATIDHSWALLTAAEQQTLQRLAVFRGGFTREAAQAVAQATLPRLTALFDKSLVQRVGDNRYDLHELVRQYAAIQLTTAEQATGAPTAAHSHAHYFVELAAAARQQWHGPEQAVWAERLQQELDNFRAVQSWIATAGDVTLAPRLANALWRFWEMRGYVAEGRRWINALLAKRELHPSVAATLRVRTQLLHVAGLLARIQGDFAQAREAHLESLALRQQQGDEVGMAAALVGLGNVAMFMGDYAAAEAHFAANLAIHRQRNHVQQIHVTYNNLAIVAMYQGNYAHARQLHEEVLAYHRQQGAQDGIAGALGNLGDVLRYQGDYPAAERVLLESLAIFEQLQNVQGQVVTLSSLGRLALALGQLTTASAWFTASLRLYTVASDKIAMVDNLEGMAQVATRNQADPRAITLYGAAAALRHALHLPVPPIDQREQADYLTLLRTRVAANLYAVAWAQGQALTLEQVIAYALTPG